MDSYNKLRVIGKGSYGEVWLVKHKRDRKQYVLKKMELKNASKRERKAAEQEAKLLAKLKHPNIVSYKDSFETEEGYLYIAMGYCEGGDLYGRLKEQKGSSLEERQVVEWFVQIAMALQYMHERNILHRDLKTQNIFLTKSKIIKVGDLGIARVLDNSSDMAQTLIGTPYYMSPELFSNKPYNHKSDVWALGCCVYEMATLKHAFNAKDMNSLVYKILRGKMPLMPKQYAPELVTLIRAMLNSNPDKRPSVNRILRDPYIKKNIALFLEGTKKRQAASNRRPSSESSRKLSSSEETTSSRSSSQASVMKPVVSDKPPKHPILSHPSPQSYPIEERLEPLKIGPDLEPIMEEVSPRGAPDNRLNSPFIVHRKSSRSPNARSQSRSPSGSRSATPSKDKDSALPPSGAKEHAKSAIRKKKKRHKPIEIEVEVDVSTPESQSKSSNAQHKSSSHKSIYHSAKPVAHPRPLPPRPGSAGDSKPHVARHGNLNKKHDGPYESGYASQSAASSVGESGDADPYSARDPEDTPRASVNLSARARRREKKESETPRTARSVDIDQSRRSNIERPSSAGRHSADYAQDIRDGKAPRPKSAGYLARRAAEKKETPKSRLIKQPSIPDESSSENDAEEEGDGSVFEDTGEKTKEKENKRKDKEINNFISALDHTLNNQRTPPYHHEDGEDSPDADIAMVDEVDEPDAAHDEQQDQVTDLPKKVLVNETYVKQKPSRAPRDSSGIDVPEITDENVRNKPTQQVRTLGTSTRLMDRITVLRKDCIRGLGVLKLKNAYDILDNVEGEELEENLVELLGKHDFDIYAGKIWQLKFCEEAAFGLI